METNAQGLIEKPVRKFLPAQLKIESWSTIQPYFEELKNRPVNSTEDLKKWLKDKSELASFLEEELGWRFIKMSCNTMDGNLSDAYEFFISNISPHIEEYSDLFNKKFLESPYVNELDPDKYGILIRGIKREVEVFCKENIPLFVEIRKKEQKYAAITSSQTIEHDDRELTLQEAENYYKSSDRQLRENIFNKVKERRSQDWNALDELFTNLVGLRDRVGQNAGFDNFRDYKFASMGRFDYTPEDCFDFHNSIEQEVVPLTREIDRDRKTALGFETLRPWDMEVDTEGKPALKPFESGQELLENTIECFRRIKPEFAEYLSIMREMKHLDLDSRKGKAPGGFNYPLYEVGVPFIFMNSVGSHRDLVTLLHEGGHAIHSFLSRDIDLVEFKDLTSEIAELASMSMELISMDHWDIFFPDPEDLRRAKKKHLEKVLKTLPWVATIDKFQHWIYENPGHSSEERKDNWRRIEAVFGSDSIDWSGHEDALDNIWQKQLHLYEVPFYYIEYGMAQLGAIAVWRNYKKDPQKAVEQYSNALKLGYTKTIPEVYETAGIKFDFSRDYVRELVKFVKEELKAVQ